MRLLRVAAFVMSVVFGSSVALADPPLVLTQKVFIDPASANMPSHAVLVPKGWTAEGGAYWPGAKIFRVLPSQHITVTAPDGSMTIVGPSFVATDAFPSALAQQEGIQRPAEGTIANGTPVLYMPGSPEEWARWIGDKAIRARYEGAENLVCQSIEKVPELTELLHQRMQPLVQQQAQANQQAQQFNLQQESWCDGMVLAARCTYDHNGQKWEQLFVWGVMLVGSDSQRGRQIWWAVEPNVSFRAPAGKLDDAMPLLLTIANSVRMTPQWANMKATHQAKLAEIDRRGAAAIHAIRTQTAREVRDIINKGWNERQAINEKAHSQYIQSIREVNEYTVPGSNTVVELPSHYNHVYANGNGEYILTDDPNYNPNIDNTVNTHNWEPMQTVK